MNSTNDLARVVTVFDIDNCIANDAHRIGLIDWSRDIAAGRYDAYHAALEDDKPMPVAALKALVVGDAVFMTARPDKYRDATLRWLRRHYGDDIAIRNEHLYMRGDTNHLPGVDVKREMMSHLLNPNNNPSGKHIVVCRAYDDRDDILAMYRSLGLPVQKMKMHDTCAYTNPRAKVRGPIEMVEPADVTAADVLSEMAETYRERNAVYGDNFRRVGHVMKALHPDGVKQETSLDHELFHLWSLLIVKASRFAVSGLTHQDSIHDLAVYAAMIQALIEERRR